MGKKVFNIFFVFLILGVSFVYAKDSATEVVQQYERIISSYESWVDMITRRDSSVGSSYTASDNTAFNNHARALNNIADKAMNLDDDELYDSQIQRIEDCQRRKKRATAKFESWYYDYKQCN